MPRINEPLYWDDNNRDHVWQSHRVSPDEVEEVLFGVDGDEAVYRQLRDGDYLKFTAKRFRDASSSLSASS